MTPPNDAVLNKLARKEALLAVLLACGYFVWWYLSAYGYALPYEDKSMPELYWGLPLWFLLSCIIGPVLFTVLCALMVKFLYRPVPFENE